MGATDRAYDVVIQREGLADIRVPVQTPAARGWLETHKEAMAEALAIRLDPVQKPMPPVVVRIPAGCKPVYFRIVSGTITANAQEQTVQHCVGYEDERGDRFVLGVNPDGVVSIVEGR